MSRASGLLVVNRLAFLRDVRSSAGVLRRPALALDDETVFRRYRGFDGVLWPEPRDSRLVVENGLVPVALLGAVRDYRSRLGDCLECEILGVFSEPPEPSEEVLSGFRSIGFDVGYLESEWSHFSSILNEVLYGRQDGLTAFAPRLNGDLLLACQADVDEFRMCRNRLVADAADLEEGAMKSFGIYAEA